MGISIAGGRMRRPLAAGVFALVACAPGVGSIDLPGARTVAADCRGDFTRDDSYAIAAPPLVQNYATSVTLATVGPMTNIGSVAFDPTTRSDRPAGRYAFELTGSLTNACEAGAFRITAENRERQPRFPRPNGDSQDYSVTAAPIAAAAPRGVTPTRTGALILASGGAGYTATFTCCPAPAARTFALSVARSINMQGMTVAPAAVTCPAAPAVLPPTTVVVRGQLVDRRMQGRVILEARSPAGNCSVATAVESAL